MTNLLAVPVICTTAPCRGNLYLSEKDDGTPFSVDDEATVMRFAGQAAVAIDNAYLHQQMAELGAARERVRIAHEMHDGMAQLLAYVNTKAQAVREHLRQGNTGDAKRQLGQLSEAARQVYGDVRGKIFELRTSAPSGGGFVEDLEVYIDRWRAETGMEVELRLPENLPELSPEVELQLLRTLQEAMTNVRKHARARRVTVDLGEDSGMLRAVVEDDGVGFDPSAPGRRLGPRFGLSTMRERIASLRGRIDIRSEPGQGTRVAVSLPLARTAVPRSLSDATADR